MKEYSNKPVKIIPLGGLNEIGKNMTLIEYKDEILIIDCGLSFPDDEMFGIDMVIPDFDYLIGFLAAIFLLFIMAVCIITFVQRIFEIVLLYIVSPYFVSTMPLISVTLLNSFA